MPVVAAAVTLNNYRNWARLVLEPHPRLNLLCGPNGQGKSNLLEALYALVITRPYRAAREQDVIRFDEAFAHVHASLSAGGREVSCEIAWQKAQAGGRQRKEIRINRQPVHRLVDVFGKARMVLFTPRDLELVQGAPEHRRRYLDVLLCQIHPGHLYAVSQYQKVLQERNRWLRGGAADAGLGAAFNEQMIRWGSAVVERRATALERLVPILERIYLQLSGKRGTLALRYLASTPREADESVAQALERHLMAHEREERLRGTSLYGPHRDDVSLLLDGHPLRAFGSQGQMRCVALGLRLAEGEMLGRETGESPILLLDDCLSEIDPQRQEALWDYLARREQVFLTTSAWDERIAPPMAGRYFRVDGGRATALRDFPGHPPAENLLEASSCSG